MKRGLSSSRSVALCALVFALSAGTLLTPTRAAAAEPNSADVAKPAVDDDTMPPPGYLPGHREYEGLSLSPHAPGQSSVLPGGLIPAFGAPLRPADGAKFDFHGYLQAGGRTGLGKRQNPAGDQSSLIWHGDPVVPRGNVFENTNTVPYTWAELRFSYSLPSVTATVSLGAWSLSESMQAAGAFQANAQLWVRDAFLTYVPKGLGKIKLTWNLGVFEGQYGGMAEYSTGAYGTPLVASIPGVGETLSVGIPLGDGLQLDLEHGIKSYLERPPIDIPTGAGNNWQKPWEGQSFANHAHVGFNYKDTIRPTFHFITATAQDDQADHVPLGNLRSAYPHFEFNGGMPGIPIDAVGSPSYDHWASLDHGDGSLQILAGDVRVALKRFGHFYGGVSHTSVDHVRSLSNVVQVLSAGGGRDLMDRYFGRNNDGGSGSLTLVGGQYDVSLGELLRYPDEFWGEGPDLKLSLFGMVAHIESEDPARDGEDKYKFGAEATYSLLPWLAASGRVDRSVPYAHTPKVLIYPKQNDNSFSVLTLKAVFRSDWKAREALTLQYSRYFYRSNFHLVSLNAGGQISSQSDEPDQNVIALFGTLWW